MSTATTTDLLRASLLRAGLGPLQLTDHAGWDSGGVDGILVQPTQDSPGFDVDAYAVAMVDIKPSGASPGRRMRLGVATFDAASTYTLVAGGVTVASATPATEEALWTAIVAWAAPTGWTITGVDADGVATDVAAERTGVHLLGPPGASVSWTATSGSPDLTCEVDAVQFLARVYTRRKEAAYNTRAGVDGTGWTRELEVVVDSDGYAKPDMDVGPATTARIWVTNAVADASDACSPSTDGVTIYPPFGRIIPCTLGGPTS